jgi:ribosome biogenesis GTPase / thiamine phosphate phosphatase
MSQRKISRRQHFRITKIQEQRLKRAEKRLENPVEEQNLGPEQQGTLITHHGVLVDVEDLKQHIYRCNIRQHLGPLVAGDQVIFQKGKGLSGVVVALQDRKSILSRPDSRQNMKVIAANIDQVVIVIACEPLPSLSLLDSYLVACHYLKLPVLILLNKVDLLNDALRSSLHDILTLYGNIGYNICTASTQKSDGLLQLKSFLRDKTSVFVGQSGVGKSSLINKLVPHANMSIGALSRLAKLGTHTTTRSHLFHLPSQGTIIDSPGIREFALWPMSSQELNQGFHEFAPYLDHCKFRNCRHKQEPQCAIREAVEAGKISSERLQSYLHLLEQHV